MGRPAKLQREEVLLRATRLFWEKGCDAVSTRDLEEALELRAPAIYRRFQSKGELFARCVDHYVDTVVMGRIRTELEGTDDPIGALHRFFLATLAPDGREPRLRGCLLANTATHADGQIPEVREAMVRGWRLMDGAFRQLIAQAQREGQLDTDLTPEALSQALLLSLQGLLTLLRAGIADLRPGVEATLHLLRRRSRLPLEDAGASAGRP